MMPRLILRTLAAILTFGVIPVAAQEGRFSVSGTVVNAATGEPLKQALVILTRFPRVDTRGDGKPAPRARVTPISSTSMTDSVGTFRFDALQQGQYSISAEKPQFTP